MKSIVAGLPGIHSRMEIYRTPLSSKVLRDSAVSEEVHRLIHELDRLGARVEHLEDRLDDFECSAPGSWVIELPPQIERLSEDARRTFEEICDWYGAGEDGGRIGDLAFCALAEARMRQTKFSRGISTLAGPALAAEAGGLLHNLKRAATAVQAALCEDVGLEPTLSLERELALALEVRTAYARLIRDVERIAAMLRPQDGDAEAALRSAAISIALLTGRDIFRKLRPQDRHLVRALQERILAWRGEDPPNAGTARRLWEDLYGCTQLLHHVNRRQELVEHDRLVLLEIEEIVALAPSAEAVRDRVIEKALRLAGRDGSLDALLCEKPGMDELLAALRGLRFGSIRSAAGEPHPQPL